MPTGTSDRTDGKENAGSMVVLSSLSFGTGLLQAERWRILRGRSKQCARIVRLRSIQAGWLHDLPIPQFNLTVCRQPVEMPLRNAKRYLPTGGGRAFRDRSNHLQLESINDEVRSFYRLLKVQRLLDCLQLYGSLLLADVG